MNIAALEVGQSLEEGNRDTTEGYLCVGRAANTKNWQNGVSRLRSKRGSTAICKPYSMDTRYCNIYQLSYTRVNQILYREKRKRNIQ